MSGSVDVNLYRINMVDVRAVLSVAIHSPTNERYEIRPVS